MTFLFADLRDYTTFVEERGDEAASQLTAAYSRIVRAQVAQHRGAEIKTEGDSFFIAFTTARQALSCAMAIVRAAEAHNIRHEGMALQIGVGLHAGEPVRRGGDYVGSAVNIAARLAQNAEAGELLISDLIRGLLRTSGLPPLVERTNLTLKNVADPPRIWSVDWHAARQESAQAEKGGGAATQLSRRPTTNLPASANALLGRSEDLTAIEGLLRQPGVRLLTITGPGGIGKTRLALEAASRNREHFRDGAWWVPLESVVEPTLVLPTVAQTLGLRGDVLRHLAGQSVLFVFDNFEQVIEAAPDVGRLLAASAGVKLLVTSRERLHIDGEHEYALEPLNEDAAVALFFERARALKPGFRVDDDLTVIASICRRLDRVPLAIELAASHTKLLSAPALLSRLEQSLPILIGGRRDAPRRQRTMEATIAWSYDSLSERDKRLFTRLSVFLGGCTLEAAEAICEADLDALGSLLDKSLIRRDGDRFLMLETTREYGLGRLVGSHDGEQTKSRHAAWYTALAERGERDIRGDAGAEAGRQVEAEHDNLRAVLRRSLERGDADACLKLAVTLAPFWYEHGHLFEGLIWLSEALSRSAPIANRTRARALNRAGAIAFRYGDLVQARSHWETGLQVADEIGEDWVAASVHSNLGTLALADGDYVEAAHRYEKANAFFLIEPGYDLDAAICLDHLATLELLQGRLRRASELSAQGLALARKVANDAQIACTLHTAAMTDLAAGDLAGAMVSLEEALDRARSVGDIAKTVAVIEGYAAVGAASEAWERAACLFGFAEAYRASSHISDPVTHALAQPYLDLVRSGASAEALSRGWSMGQSMNLDAALVAIRDTMDDAAAAAHADGSAPE